MKARKGVGVAIKYRLHTRPSLLSRGFRKNLAKRGYKTPVPVKTVVKNGIFGANNSKFCGLHGIYFVSEYSLTTFAK